MRLLWLLKVLNGDLADVVNSEPKAHVLVPVLLILEVPCVKPVFDQLIFCSDQTVTFERHREHLLVPNLPISELHKNLTRNLREQFRQSLHRLFR